MSLYHSLPNGFDVCSEHGLTACYAPLFTRAGVLHRFTTRLGGASDGIYAQCNMGFARGEPADVVLENYRRHCAAMGASIQMAVLTEQVHGVAIQTVGSGQAGQGIIHSDMPQADALVTAQPSLVLVKLFADCVPVLLYDPVHQVLANIHAGWRGTLAGIGQEVLKHMERVFGTQPEDCLTAIGPSIGPCCFEVDREVADRFASAYGQEGIDDTRGDKPYLDLWHYHVQGMLDSGILPGHIALAALCTCCDPQRFYSHRRDGLRRGTMAMLASIAEPT